MLNHITITNLAIVDSLELELEPGLSVLTGETGAGKSILIDALGLVLGDRADAGAIRHGAERADIIAEFDAGNRQDVRHWLQENDLNSENDCIIRRTISAKGRSRGFINGQPVPLQLLKELGEKLVNIHGQNTHQALLKTHEQKLMLDSFAALTPACKQLNQLFHKWKNLTGEYQQLKQATEARDARLSLLQFQVQELEEFGLQENELELLEEEHRRLSNANRLIETTQAVRYQLSENDNNSISRSLNHCFNELTELSEIDQQLQSARELLNNAIIQIDEADSELRHYLDSLELDPERLNWLNERISSAYDLSRKHRIEASELSAYGNRLQQELLTLETAGDKLEQLQAELNKLKSDYFTIAIKLGKDRAKAAKQFSLQVEKHIHELGMGNCVFKPEVIPVESEQPQAYGMETIEFYVSTNPGQPLRPLSKVVSGGELSRISLAIQVVTAQFSEVPTLIFDEVDVGIGGGVAEMVGKKLRLLGNHSQILCVTHQAQVASQAHQHLNVVKTSSANQTTTTITFLDETQRIEELARMMGGVKITSQTRSHAMEMLRQVAVESQ